MSVLSYLSIRHKFALVGALALATAAVPAAGWIHGLWTAMQQSRLEQAGLPLGGTMIQVARLTARHRGLTNGALAGNAEAEAQRAKAWQALQALREPTLTTFRAFGDADLVQRVEANWQAQAALTDAVVARSVPAPEAFARHTALIDRELGVLSDVAVRAGLVMHPEQGGFQLQDAALNHLPLVAELMGRVRGRGMGVLSSGQIAPGARAQVAALVDRIAATSSGASRAVALAMAADPALQASLGQPAAAAQAAMDETLALARRAIVDADVPTVAPADWWAATTKAIDLQLALGDAAKQALDAQIERSADAAQATLAGGLALMLALATAAALLCGHITRTTAKSIDDAIALADAVAAGDLRLRAATGADAERIRDEGARLRAALARMAGELREVVGGVRDNAAHVATASAQIADGNQDLSSRTESQASALQETAAAMEELRSTTGASAEHAQQAADLARRAREVAEAGGASVGDLVGTMEQISESARRMQDIVATIDGLAFQTNILALNAAVEAARAGEQGRGFAVVAGEVRALAQRSGAAAREIRGLIAASEERVVEGSAKGGRVRETMGDVVSSIGRVAELIIEVSSAMREQARGIEQVGEAVTQMDHHTQQNAALVEQSAAAAESLRRQAGSLQGSVERFRLEAQAA